MTTESLKVAIDSSDATRAAAGFDRMGDAADRGMRSLAAMVEKSKDAAEGQKLVWDRSLLVYRTVDQQSKNLNRATISAGQYSNAMRMLPAQLTDVVTQLAAGQPAWQIAIQQGGQIRDSFGGVATAGRALLSVLTPVRLAAGGAAVAAGLLVKQFVDGEREAAAFNRAIILTGGTAGTTADQLGAMARQLAGIKHSQGDAAGVLAVLANTGRLSGEQLEQAAKVALDMKRVAGVSIDETVRNFTSLADRPVEAVKALDRQYHFLTASIRQQIEILQEQGRTQDAATLAITQYTAAMNSRLSEAEQRMGTLQRLGQGLSQLSRAMFGGFNDIGRDLGDAGQLGLLQQRREIEGRGLGRGYSASGPEASAQRERDARERALQQRVDLTRRESAQRTTANQLEEAAFEASRRILDNYLDATAKSVAEEFKVRDALDDADTARIGRQLAGQLSVYEGAQSKLELLRELGLVSQERYVEQSKALLQAEGDAQVRAINEEIALARQRNVTGAERVRNEEHIRDLQEEGLRIAQQTSEKIDQIGIRDRARLNSQRAALDEARIAADRYLESLSERYARDQAGIGRGNQFRARQSGEQAVDNDFSGQRQKLEDQRELIKLESKWTDTQEQQYQERLALIDEYHSKAMQLFSNDWEALQAKQRNWMVGAGDAFANYLSETRNVAGQTEQLFSKAFHGAEDALVQFVMTGKGGFRDLADSIIADLLRMQIRSQLGSAIGSPSGGGLLGLLGGLLGGGGGSQSAASYVSTFFPGRASGGPIEAGRPYIVGERGPEIIVPRTAGAVIPNGHSPGGGAGITIVQNLNPAPNTDVATFAAMLRQALPALRAAVADDARRGRNGWNRVT
jgi:lambda family phage tail tape measure protein